MKYPENLVGQKFNKLTVIAKVPDKQIEGCSVWKCRCDCGNVIEVGRKVLVVGRKKSCGCTRYKNQVTVHCVKCGKTKHYETKFTSENLNVICEDCLRPIKEKVNTDIKEKMVDIWANAMGNAKPEDFEN